METPWYQTPQVVSSGRRWAYIAAARLQRRGSSDGHGRGQGLVKSSENHGQSVASTVGKLPLDLEWGVHRSALKHLKQTGTC